MKTFLVVLIGLIGGYLVSVGIYNDWCLFAALEPTETVKRVFACLYLSFLCSVAAWAVLTAVFEWWD
ncbi:hypothetical protein [Bacteroides sp.]|uniref:hypothetical protein n=1 Tax=Bacteroides sp. TaxID=29523 RepID=UPI002FC86F2E